MSLFNKSLSLSVSLMILGGCAYSVEQSYQRVTFETPGAEGAKCHVYVDGLHFPVNVPAEISIPKTKNDMKINCLAPGNRQREVVVAPEISEVFKDNFANLYVGAVWDSLSGAMYKFPDVIRVDFAGIEPKDYPLPKHDAYDLKPTHQYALEEFLPSQLKLNADKFIEQQPIKKIDRRAGDKSGIDVDLDSAFGPRPNRSSSSPDSLSSSSDLPPSLPISLSDLVDEEVSAPAPDSGSFVIDDDFSRFNDQQ